MGGPTILLYSDTQNWWEILLNTFINKGIINKNILLRYLDVCFLLLWSSGTDSSSLTCWLWGVQYHVWLMFEEVGEDSGVDEEPTCLPILVGLCYQSVGGAGVGVC